MQFVVMNIEQEINLLIGLTTTTYVYTISSYYPSSLPQPQ